MYKHQPSSLCASSISSFCCAGWPLITDPSPFSLCPRRPVSARYGYLGCWFAATTTTTTITNRHHHPHDHHDTPLPLHSHRHNKGAVVVAAAPSAAARAFPAFHTPLPAQPTGKGCVASARARRGGGGACIRRPRQGYDSQRSPLLEPRVTPPARAKALASTAASEGVGDVEGGRGTRGFPSLQVLTLLCLLCFYNGACPWCCFFSAGGRGE